MMTSKDKRAKRARAKHLEALAFAQASRASIWSTVSYRHGNKSFADHGTYSLKGLTDHQKQGMGGHDNDK